MKQFKLLPLVILLAASSTYANSQLAFTPNNYIKSKISQTSLKGPVAAQEKAAADSGFNSNSSNFSSMFTGSVDGRTGNYSMSINFGYALANSGAGPTYPLKLSYSTANKIDIGFGTGWALNLTHYDPNTNTLSLGSGGSYHILWENNKPVLEYQKIKDLVITKSNDKSILFNLAFKDGHRETVDIYGDISVYQNIMGRKLFFNYDKNRSLHILDSITDKSGKVLQHIDYMGNKVIAHSLHGADVDHTVTIFTNNSYLTRIEEGSTDHNLVLSYGPNRLISNIISSMGSSTQFKYTTLNGPGLEKVPAIIEETVNPGNNEPIMSSSYAYSLADGHNYLGYAAGVQYKKGIDNLYLRPTNYNYQTSVTRNAGTTLITSYNKFNLILKQELMGTTSGIKLLQLDYTYPKWQNMTLPDLSHSYAYATSIVEHSFNANGDESAPAFINQHFDDEGNLVDQSDIEGYKKTDSYSSPDQNGFKTSLISSQLKPVDPTDKVLPLVNNTFKYLNFKNIAGINIPLPSEDESKEIYKGTSIRDLHSYTQYYTDSSKPDYGLKKYTYSNQGMGDFNKVDYSYQFNQPITVLGTTYNTNVITSSNPNGLNPPLVFKHYVDTLTGQQVLGIGPEGYKTSQTYDNNGRVKSVVTNIGTPSQATINYTYDGNYITVGSPNRAHTKVLTDGLGRKIKLYKESTSNGSFVPGQWDLVNTWTYTSTGKISSVTNYDKDVLPVTKRYLFDKYDNSIGIVSSFGTSSIGIVDPINDNKIDYSLAPNKQMTGSSICTFASTSFSCKALSIKVSSRDPKTRDLTGVYNLVTDPNAKDDNGKFIYNSTLQAQLKSHIANDLGAGKRFDDTWLKGWVIAVIAAKEYYTSNTATYDKYHFMQSSTNSDNVVTTYTYNDHKEIMSKKTAGRLTTIYHYDKNQVLDGIGFQRNGSDIYLGHRTYNNIGQLTSSQDVAGNVTSYAYNRYGLITSSTTPNGHTFHYVYSENGKLHKVYTDDHIIKSAVTYTYDKDGKLVFMDAPTDTVTYSYSPDNHLIEIKRHDKTKLGPSADSTEKFSDFGWAGVPQTKTDSNGDVYTNTYDKYGRLTAALINGKVMLSRKSDLDGAHPVITVDDGNISTTGTSDDIALPKTLTVAYKGAAKIKLVYTHYRDGRLKTKTRDDGSKSYSKSYTYDALGNLLTYKCSGSLCPSDSHDNVVASDYYTFDDVNNIKTVKATYANGNTNTTTYNYDTVDPTRLVSYTNSDALHLNSNIITYDKDGNVLSDDQGNKFTYDAHDRVSSMADARGVVYNYTYNGAGELVQRGKVKYSYGLAGLESINDNGQITKYIKDIGTIAVIDPHKNVLYNVSGSRGGSIARLTKTGVLVHEYTYTPYGDRSPENRSYSGFNGSLSDKTTNISSMGSSPGRAYSPVLRRFMSHDSSSPFNSGGINGYVFVTNDPVNKTDPSGHVPAWLSQMGVVGAIAGAVLTSPMLITPLAPLAVVIDAGVGVSLANSFAPGNSGLNAAASVMGHINNVIYMGLGFGALSIGAATVNAMVQGNIAADAINVVSAAGEIGGASLGISSAGASETSSILKQTNAADAGTLDILNTYAAGSGLVGGLMVIPSMIASGVHNSGGETAPVADDQADNELEMEDIPNESLTSSSESESGSESDSDTSSESGSEYSMASSGKFGSVSRGSFGINMDDIADSDSEGDKFGGLSFHPAYDGDDDVFEAGPNRNLPRVYRTRDGLIYPTATVTVDNPVIASGDFYSMPAGQTVLSRIEEIDESIPYSYIPTIPQEVSVPLKPMFTINELDFENVSQYQDIMNKYREANSLNTQNLILSREMTSEGEKTTIYDPNNSRQATVLLDGDNELIMKDEKEVVIGWTSDPSRWDSFEIDPTGAALVFDAAATNVGAQMYEVGSLMKDVSLSLEAGGRNKYPVIIEKTSNSSGGAGAPTYTISRLNIDYNFFSFDGEELL